jgi:hypothetical protein
MERDVYFFEIPLSFMQRNFVKGSLLKKHHLRCCFCGARAGEPRVRLRYAPRRA